MSGKEKAKMTVSEYMDYATAHGIGRVKNSPYIVLKICWVVVVLGSIAIVGVQLSRLAEKWKSQPISTSIGLETQPYMRFPAVTICNLNPLRYSLIQTDAILMSAVQVAAEQWNISLDRFDDNENYTGTYYNISEEVKQVEKATNDGSADIMSEYFRIKMGAEDPNFIGELSHQIEDMMVSCSFNGVKCKLSFFTRYRDYEYGVCNTFGMRESDNTTVENIYTVYSPGKDYGLKMILNAEQEEYLPFITPSAGLIVNIHSPDNIPWARESGIVVSPGFNTEIAVEISDQDRIPGQNQRCDANNKYESLAECRAECFTSLVPEQCGCSINVADYQYYDTDDYDGANSSVPDGESVLRDCNAKRDTFCVLRVRNDLGAGRATCKGCLSPCRQTSYVTSVTTTKWPAMRYRPVLEKILESYSSKDIFSTAEVNDNLAQVTIFLPSFTREVLKEEGAYTDENFVSDIGGQLGLWIGFSVLSLCELVELVILIVNSCFTKKVTPVEKLK